MPKFIFDLPVSGDWPPVNAESLWLTRTELGYVLESIPFFIEGVAFGDILEIDVRTDTQAELISVVQPSGNSTIWLYIRKGVNQTRLLKELSNLNIGSESGGIEGYIAINLPAKIEYGNFMDVVGELLETGLAEIAHGVLRHDTEID